MLYLELEAVLGRERGRGMFVRSAANKKISVTASYDMAKCLIGVLSSVPWGVVGKGFVAVAQAVVRR